MTDDERFESLTKMADDYRKQAEKLLSVENRLRKVVTAAAILDEELGHN